MLKQPEKQLPIKVIQFGEGNFLRAFVDWMIHKMNQAGVFNGQVAVVQPLETGLIHLLKEQDYCYTHFLKGIKDGQPYEEHYVNQSIQTAINPYDDFEGFLDLAAIKSAEIIVSNTTEAGIEFKDTDKMTDKAGVTYPGKLTQLLYNRYKLTEGSADSGFILLPCELIDHNADKLKEAVLKYADLWSLGDSFIQWINEANTFCNTLVDRIVPGYPRDTIDEVIKKLGYNDNLVVESELFNLWVIEGNDKVRQAIPADKAGCNAIVVDDVTPYKTRKVRILNGAHTTLVPTGYLYGCDTVGGSMEDPVLKGFLTRTMYEEIIPTLTLSKEELEAFAKDVTERFMNPFIKHYLLSISLNSMSKYRTRILPSVTGYLEINKTLPKRLVSGLAAYIIFYRGTYNGKTIETNDSADIIDLFDNAWAKYDGSKESLKTLVTTILAYEENWYGDLNHIPGLTELLTDYVDILLKHDMKTLISTVDEVI